MKISQFLLAAAAGVFVSSSFAVPSYGAPGVAPHPVANTAAAYRISGPFSSGNLSVYLIHGSTAPQAGKYMTLQEGLKSKQVVVHETGNVNELTIENKGNQIVFIQSGDILKGGQQDRAVQLDLVLPPRSGKVPLNSFCVEHGRWSGRGAEASGQFSSSSKQFVAKEMKLAAKMTGNNYSGTGQSVSPSYPVMGGGTAGAGLIASRPNPALIPSPQAVQGKMWDSVAKVQGKLESAAKGNVKSSQSESSLQLTLETDAVKKKGESHVKALSKVVEGKPDVIGYAFAVNGKMNSADVYASNDLFVKLWPKLLDASATEAVSEETPAKANARPVPAPTVNDVKAVLTDAEKAKPQLATTNNKTRLITRMKTQDNSKNVLFETQAGIDKQDWVHRNYISK